MNISDSNGDSNFMGYRKRYYNPKKSIKVYYL